MMGLFILAVFLCLGCVCHAGESPEVLLTIEPSEEFPRNSEGDIVSLENGTLCLVYTRFSSGGNDNDKAEIVARKSMDMGKTWSGDKVLVRDEGLENVMSVSLLELDNEELLLFYLRKNAIDDCILYVRRSSDGLKTLSKPIRAIPADGYHVVNNDRVVQLTSGRIVIPAAYHQNVNGRFHAGAICRIFYSDDNGKSWQPDKTPIDEVASQELILQEPGVLELEDGRLWMWMRTNKGYQYQCFSSDQGLTWSEPESSPLASPKSPASIERMPWNGTLLAIWNDHSNWHLYREGKRTPLCMSVSDDEGKSWCKSRVIEGDPDGWYCYTSITFVDDSALLSFCAGDSVVGGLNRLKVLRLPQKWLEME